MHKPKMHRSTWRQTLLSGGEVPVHTRRHFNKLIGGGVKRAVGVLKRCLDQRDIGFVFVTELNSGVRIEISGQDKTIDSGKHGFHLHEAGDMRYANRCDGACAHYDNSEDASRSHAGLNGGGHAGDFGNITVHSDGHFRCRIDTTQIKVEECYGRAMILHAKEDDLGMEDNAESKTTGNSGARIAFALMGIASCERPFPTCLTCGSMNGSNIVSEVLGTAPWIKEAELTHAGPKNCQQTNDAPPPSICVRFKWPEASLGSCKDNEWIFWAAEPLGLKEAVTMQTPKLPIDAYGRSFNNCGRVEFVNGMAECKLRAPQAYAENGVLWPPHIHIQKGSAGGDGRVFTIPAWPSHHRKDYTCTHIKDSPHEACSILTNAYVKTIVETIKTIENDNLYSVCATGEADKDIFERDSKHITLDYKSSDAIIRKTLLPIGTSPVVVFCANEKCKAASQLIEKMMRLGIGTRLYYAPEGYENE